MKPNFDLKNLPYISRIPTAVIFSLLFASAFLLFQGRKHAAIRPDFILSTWPDFYQHISNFSISYMLYTIIGFMWLHFGLAFKYIVSVGIILLAINFIYELWIPVLNTPDIMDAYYGAIGIAVAFIFLIAARRFGMKENKVANDQVNKRK